VVDRQGQDNEDHDELKVATRDLRFELAAHTPFV